MHRWTDHGGPIGQQWGVGDSNTMYNVERTSVNVAKFFGCAGGKWDIEGVLSQLSEGDDVFFGGVSAAGCGYRDLVEFDVGVRARNSNAEF